MLTHLTGCRAWVEGEPCTMNCAATLELPPKPEINEHVKLEEPLLDQAETMAKWIEWGPKLLSYDRDAVNTTFDLNVGPMLERLPSPQVWALIPIDPDLSEWGPPETTISTDREQLREELRVETWARVMRFWRFDGPFPVPKRWRPVSELDSEGRDPNWLVRAWRRFTWPWRRGGGRFRCGCGNDSYVARYWQFFDYGRTHDPNAHKFRYRCDISAKCDVCGHVETWGVIVHDEIWEAWNVKPGRIHANIAAQMMAAQKEQKDGDQGLQ